MARTQVMDGSLVCDPQRDSGDGSGSYLNQRRAGEQDGLIVQLQNRSKALIAVFKALSKDHRGDDVAHCGRYGVVGIERSSWEYDERHSGDDEHCRM